MLSDRLAAECRSLLARGFTKTAIAESLQISRKTVLRIQRGQWGRSRKPKADTMLATCPKILGPETFRDDWRGPPVRCAVCGHMVYLADDGQPCHACRVRAAMADGEVRRMSGTRDPSAEIRFDLDPEAEARRRQIPAAGLDND